MEGSAPCSTTLPAYVRLRNEDCPKTESAWEPIEIVPYSSVVESMTYPMMGTELDAAFAVGIINRFISNPDEKWWEAIKIIM